VDKKECQDCGSSWESEDTIYEHFLKKYSHEGAVGLTKAIETALVYGATEENQVRFGKNVFIVEYDYTSPNRYDGWSETHCQVCGAKRGRWSNKLLKQGEEELRYGGN
jgi:hypothetical protein